MAAEYQYMIAAADRVFVLLSHSPNPARVDLAEASSICCNTLEILSNDALFFRDVETLGQRQRNNSEAFREITGATTRSLGHFHHFWEREKSLLIMAGMDRSLVERLSRIVDEMIERIRETRLSVVHLRNVINAVRDDTCNLSNTLNQSLQEERDLNAVERGVRRGWYAIIGAAIVALDVSSLVATVGLSAAGTAVSRAVGGALIGAAVPSA